MCVYMCTYMSICVCMCSGVEAAVSSSSTAGTIWAQVRARVGLLESLAGIFFVWVWGAGNEDPDPFFLFESVAKVPAASRCRLSSETSPFRRDGGSPDSALRGSPCCLRLVDQNKKTIVFATCQVGQGLAWVPVNPKEYKQVRPLFVLPYQRYDITILM